MKIPNFTDNAICDAFFKLSDALMTDKQAEYMKYHNKKIHMHNKSLLKVKTRHYHGPKGSKCLYFMAT